MHFQQDITSGYKRFPLPASCSFCLHSCWFTNHSTEIISAQFLLQAHQQSLYKRLIFLDTQITFPELVFFATSCICLFKTNFSSSCWYNFYLSMKLGIACLVLVFHNSRKLFLQRSCGILWLEMLLNLVFGQRLCSLPVDVSCFFLQVLHLKL